MTREEAITWLIQPTVTSTKVSASKAKEQEAYDMAIEALQVEPTKAVCDDCIWHVCNYNKVDWDTPSAEVVHKPDYSYEADMVRRMKEALSAEAEWIPCSERLPDVDIEVLTTTDWSDVLIAWIGKGGAWETEEHILDNDEILAWMPLPEPYREDGEA